MQAVNEWLNILPKSSQASKEPPPPPTDNRPVTLPLRTNDTLKWLTPLPALVDNRSSSDVVALGLVPLPHPPTFWQLRPRQHPSADN